MDENTNQQDQPAMAGGNDELAQTLNGGLQFGQSNDDQNVAPSDNAQGPFNTDSGNNDDAVPSMGAMSAPDNSHDSPTATSDLDKLKNSALDDLRPLVGKLNLNPEERFDTLLLIIRSTDDQSLLQQAHAAAKEISDDSKRAQALLDVIKEVDYFNNKK